MIIGVWNIRGLCSSKKQAAVNSWANKNALDVFGILETKLYNSEQAGKCISFFTNRGFKLFVDNSCLGRILLFWKAHVKVTILDVFDQGILCNLDNGINKFFVGFVYGKNEPCHRKLLWRKLTLWNCWCSESSLAFLGDFNEILECGDRSSSFTTPSSAGDFQTCVNAMGVQEIHTLGSHYTWTNKNTQGNLIACKLDRCFVNANWMDLFKSSFVIVETPGISDHSPLVLYLANRCSSRPKPFKFFNVWTTHALFLQIVGNCWQANFEGSYFFSLVQKQKLLKKELRLFDKEHFSQLPHSIFFFLRGK